VKRITFTKESKDLILRGKKDVTHRWRRIPGIKSGDVVAAVSGQKGKPAFYTPAAEGFAQLNVKSVARLFLKDLDEHYAQRAGFGSLAEAQEFYQSKQPLASDYSSLWRYVFEVVR
jgi:hypothetical protein